MEATTDPTRPVPGFCRCGCGEPTPRRYRPGHDAKHHSTLAAALTSGDWRIEARAADLLADLGWTSYADRAALQAVPYRNRRGQALDLVTDVEYWQIDTDGVHHSRRTCPALCDHGRRNGQLRMGGIVADRHIEIVPTSPEIVAKLQGSWDQCTGCTTVEGRVEVAERNEIRAAHIVAAHDAETGQAKPHRLTLKQAKTGGWVVPADRIGQRPMVATLDPTDPRNPDAITRRREGDPLAPAGWAAPAA